MIIRIQREPMPAATIGRVFIDDVYEADSLELMWLDNRPRVSCIPAGVYLLAWEMSPRLKRETLRLKDVPGRDGILIHPANEVDELRGCLAFGARPPNSPGRLVRSRYAVKAVEAKALAAWERKETVVIDVRNP